MQKVRVVDKVGFFNGVTGTVLDYKREEGSTYFYLVIMKNKVERLFPESSLQEVEPIKVPIPKDAEVIREGGMLIAKTTI